MAELEGIDRGIFGTTSAKREAVLAHVAALEALNPDPSPLRRMERLAGDWRLLYTTITITGVKKTKLGLREFVKLGDFIQTIDTDQHTAVNAVSFSVTGFGQFSGKLTITAAYAPAAPPADGRRVDIAFQGAQLAPEALERLFRANYDLLLSVFNPEGWLDVTYVDDEVRVGRDDKGNVFVVERC
ncbi:MAG: plastid lipid-associated protein/fibrillin conserved domain-containing protein [Monoraphidium minutum]|nr:MAG: plastid lipid-associated protein/fibrillin conserved domain-containing protein [Monoraphidium minutum]